MKDCKKCICKACINQTCRKNSCKALPDKYPPDCLVHEEYGCPERLKRGENNGRTNNIE